MPLSRLELVSSHGDQTFERVRFVVHGTSNATDSFSILDEGLRFTEGRPTVSTNIIHAHDWTISPVKQAQSLGNGTVIGEPGTVIVCAVPQNIHLGYGIFTTAYIDRELKKVTGAPIRYASSRKQLAFYMSPETEAARIHVEAEVANGYPLEQHEQLLIEPKYLVGHFIAGSGFETLLSQFDVTVRSLQPVDFEKLQNNLGSVFQLAESANAVLMPTAIRDLIIGTIESMLISRMRIMRWQGLALLGYTFFEGKEPAQIPPISDINEHKRRMDDLGRQLASSSLFTAELAWLKIYVSHQLELMRLELDGAELEARTD